MNDEKIRNLFRITTDRMFTAIESFYVWKKLNEMMNVNDVGQDNAEKNVEILKKYWGFFHPVMNSSYKAFVTDLSLFFDAEKYDDTFSLNKLVNLVSEKISAADYSKLSSEIKDIKRRHGVKISFILELRNAEVSHQEINRKSRVVVFKEIEELFKGVQEILNLLGKYNDGSFTIWDHISDNVTNSINWVFENLERGEVVRMHEIDKKYNII